MRNFIIGLTTGILCTVMTVTLAQSFFDNAPSKTPPPTVTRNYPVPKAPTVMSANQFSSAVTTLDKTNKTNLQSQATNTLTETLPQAKAGTPPNSTSNPSNANNPQNPTPATTNSTPPTTDNTSTSNTSTDFSTNTTTPTSPAPAQNNKSGNSSGFNVKY